MLSIFLVLFHVFFASLLFIFVNRKVKKALELGNIKNEITQLIISFNRQAEKNLLFFDDKIKQMKKENLNFEENNKKLQKIKLSDFYESTSNIKKKSYLENKKKKVIKDLPFANDSKKIISKPKIKKKSTSKIQKPNVKEYFLSQKEAFFDEMVLTEKIIFLKEKEYSDREIANQLDISIDELKLYINLSLNKTV